MAIPFDQTGYENMGNKVEQAVVATERQVANSSWTSLYYLLVSSCLRKTDTLAEYKLLCSTDGRENTTNNIGITLNG